MSAATITLLFLLFAVVMFVFEKIPLGVTSMIVCVGLVVTGVLDVKTAFAGFIDSNVILFVAMFIVGGALFETGMANKIGGIVTHFAKSERSLIVAIMVIVGLMSGVLSNTGTAAVLIPVVIGIAAKSGYARSKLLMPLVFAAAMGGNLSLIGAPGNLIAQSALGEIGMSFGFFEYAIVGLPILAVGILFYATLGMKLLPNHPVSDDDSFGGEQNFSNVPKWKQVLSLVILVLTLLGMIIGFNHNSGKEGNNRIHFLLGKISGKFVGLVDSSYGSTTSTSGAFTMNTSSTNSGGWGSSQMRSKVLGSASSPTSPTANTLLAALPSDLRAVMKSCTKYTDNKGSGNTASNVSSTTDYLFLLSEYVLNELVKCVLFRGNRAAFQLVIDDFQLRVCCQQFLVLIHRNCNNFRSCAIRIHNFSFPVILTILLCNKPAVPGYPSGCLVPWLLRLRRPQDGQIPLNPWTPTGWKPGLRMALSFPSTASPWRTNTVTPRHSRQNWTGCCITSPWSMPSSCWEGR